MKKIWLWITLLVFSVLLFGCDNQIIQQDFDEEISTVFSWEIIDIKNGNKVPVEFENLWKNGDKYFYALKVNFKNIFHTINFKISTTSEIQNKKIQLLDNGRRLFIGDWLLSFMVRDNEISLENSDKVYLSCFEREIENWIPFPIWTGLAEKQWYEKNGEYYPTVKYSTINNTSDFYVYNANPYSFVKEPISIWEDNCAVELNKYNTISKDEVPPFVFWSWFENAFYMIPKDKSPESNCKSASRFIGSMIWANNFIVETNKLACHIFYLSDGNITPEIVEISVQNYGIQHDVENGTITLDNWEESITIMDRNLWANIAWIWEESYWYYFQWWNNHGFQLNSEIKTWTELVSREESMQYWPNNWYDNDIQFVVIDNYAEINSNLNKGNYFLAAVNDNLWWWSGDSEIVNRMWEYVIDQFRWDTGNPRTERKWPCPEWFHVPSFGEIHKLFKLWIDIKYPDDIAKKEHVRWMSIWGGWNQIWREFSNDLLLPMAWWIRFDGKATPHDQESEWFYWMSSPGRFLNFHSYMIVEYAESYRAATFPVRCFKN